MDVSEKHDAKWKESTTEGRCHDSIHTDLHTRGPTEIKSRCVPERWKAGGQWLKGLGFWRQSGLKLTVVMLNNSLNTPPNYGMAYFKWVSCMTCDLELHQSVKEKTYHPNNYFPTTANGKTSRKGCTEACEALNIEILKVSSKGIDPEFEVWGQITKHTKELTSWCSPKQSSKFYSGPTAEESTSG